MENTNERDHLVQILLNVQLGGILQVAIIKQLGNFIAEVRNGALVGLLGLLDGEQALDNLRAGLLWRNKYHFGTSIKIRH